MTTKIKIYIALASAAFLTIAAYSLWSNFQIRRLESRSDTLIHEAETERHIADEFEQRSRVYEEKIAYLESQLSELRSLAVKQDEELKSIETDTRNARADVERTRRIRTQAEQPLKKSAESSPNSDTGVTDVRVTPVRVTPLGVPPHEQRTPKGVTLTQACNAVADELRASRILIDAFETENSALKVRLETEKLATRLLTELNETRRRESEALKETVAAKNETIAARNAAIAAQDKLIETLKTKKRSVWSRIGDILLGAGVIAVLK